MSGTGPVHPVGPFGILRGILQGILQDHGLQDHGRDGCLNGRWMAGWISTNINKYRQVSTEIDLLAILTYYAYSWGVFSIAKPPNE